MLSVQGSVNQMLPSGPLVIASGFGPLEPGTVGTEVLVTSAAGGDLADVAVLRGEVKVLIRADSDVLQRRKSTLADRDSHRILVEHRARC